MTINNNTYLAWQEKFRQNKIFAWFWKSAGIYSLLIFYILSAVLLYQGKYKMVILAFLAFVLGRLVISPFIYLFYKRVRPCQVLGFIPPYSSFLLFFCKPPKRPNSFPSDHAVSFISLSLVFFFFYPWLGIGLLLLTLLNGMARVVLGYHYPSDILAGWVVGAFSAFLTLYAFGLFW